MEHLEKILDKDNLDFLEKTQKFSQAIAEIEGSSEHLFITGKAGTGKSTLLEYCYRNTKKKCAVLAPTGVAALNIKGQTIHSFFNFYIDVTPKKILKDYKKTRKPKLYKNLQMIIIDEVSMLRADLLDCIDTFLQMHGPMPGKSFGGIQMIFIGDLYQLPPVVLNKEDNLFSEIYKTPYFFSAQVLQAPKLRTIELNYIYRQKDENFINLLNKIRNNNVTSDDLTLLNTRYRNNIEEIENKTHIYLTSTNKKADSINLTKLHSLNSETFASTAMIEDKFPKDNYPTATNLQLKIDAQVMLLNNDSKRRWVNGTLGTIKAISQDIHGIPFLAVELSHNKKIVSIYKHTWESFQYVFEENHITSERTGSFTQYPVRLAWAITIHKSQGKTFDTAIIDLGRGSFVAGQTYVALSRCTSFEGVYLSQYVKRTDIKSHPHINKFFSDNKR